MGSVNLDISVCFVGFLTNVGLWKLNSFELFNVILLTEII